ncbi:MAG: DUF2628 domain-containing protein [Proteobacteria bacterium]|nr:DUF2628 domain-containing protein [Pseudomonadota bacterium]
MRLYTVHVRRHDPDADSDLVLIKEGFCWPAFFLGPLWALWHRLWLAALVLLVAALALGGVGMALGLDGLSQGAVAVGLAAIVGFVANDLRRRRLARRHFTLAAVVSGAGREAAEWRFLDGEPALAAELSR